MLDLESTAYRTRYGLNHPAGRSRYNFPSYGVLREYVAAVDHPSALVDDVLVGEERITSDAGGYRRRYAFTEVP